MKRISILLTIAALVSLVACKSTPAPESAPELKMTIFADHILSVAQQENISYAEAAAKIYELGYRGVDSKYIIDPEQLAILDSVGFEHACAIAHIDFEKGDQAEEVDKTFAFMQEHGYDRILLVPGLLPEGADEDFWNEMTDRVKNFVARAKELNITVMAEDFDNRRSICYNTEALDKVFAKVPDLQSVFDSGNFYYAGEDVLAALDHFIGKVRHAHLKDRVGTGERPMACPPAGEGAVPIREVVQTLKANGYDGWFTAEHYGSRQTLQDAAKTIENVRKFWDEAQ